MYNPSEQTDQWVLALQSRRLRLTTIDDLQLTKDARSSLVIPPQALILSHQSDKCTKMHPQRYPLIGKNRSIIDGWLHILSTVILLTVARLKARFVFRWVPCKLKPLILIFLRTILKFSLAIGMFYSIEQKEHLNRSLGEILFLGCYTTWLLKRKSNRKTSDYNVFISHSLSYGSFTSDMVKYSSYFNRKV